MVRSIFIFTFLLLGGCMTVEFVRKDFVPHKQGILRHSIPSSAENELKYRNEAKKQAQEFCGDDFTILKEYQALDLAPSSSGIATGFGLGRHSTMMIGGTSQNQIMYSFIEFTCK